MLLVCANSRGNVAASLVFLDGREQFAGHVKMTTDMIIRYEEGEDVPALLELQSFEKDTLGATFRILVGRLVLEDNFLLVRDTGTDDITLGADTLLNDYRF